MSKKNLLTIVQEILAETDGDEVNSITDTEESFSLARIVKVTYEDLYSQKDLPEHYELISLTALGDVTKPTHMQIPDGVKRIVWLKYNHETTSDTDLDFRDVKYIDPTSFINMSLSLSESETNVDQVTDPSGKPLLILNDRFPTWWTSFDDSYIVFDAYDSDEEASVQASRSLAWVNNIPTFSLSDTHTPDLDEDAFTILYNEAKGRYVYGRKQTIDPFADRAASRGRVALQINKVKAEEAHNARPDYGRRKR